MLRETALASNVKSYWNLPSSHGPHSNQASYNQTKSHPTSFSIVKFTHAGVDSGTPASISLLSVFAASFSRLRPLKKLEVSNGGRLWTKKSCVRAFVPRSSHVQCTYLPTFSQHSLLHHHLHHPSPCIRDAGVLPSLQL